MMFKCPQFVGFVFIRSVIKPAAVVPSALYVQCLSRSVDVASVT